jgi:hypothetical protein
MIPQPGRRIASPHKAEPHILLLAFDWCSVRADIDMQSPFLVFVVLVRKHGNYDQKHPDNEVEDVTVPGLAPLKRRTPKTPRKAWICCQV